MTLKELWVAYITYPAIIAYLTLSVAAIAADFGFPDWESLMPYSVGAFMMFGLCSLPAGRLGVPDETIAVVHAARKVGLVAVPLSSRFTADEMRYVIADSGAAVVLVDPEQAERVLAQSALAKESLQFDQAFAASPTCTPSESRRTSSPPAPSTTTVSSACRCRR